MTNVGRAVAFAVVLVAVRVFTAPDRQQQPARAPDEAPVHSMYVPPNSPAASYGYGEYPSYDAQGYYGDEDEEAVEDGSYSASVDYYNPATGWSNTYDLDVEVEDGRVTEIQFPNGGWISADEELDEDGNATVYDDEGREYSVHVDQ